MRKNKICGIYCITNLITGKQYVGQSIDIYRRWRQHRALSSWEQHSGPMYADMKLYGRDNFKLSILERCDKKELNDREYYWTVKLQTHITGYNRDVCNEHNTETKQKMSDAHKGKYFSDEHKQKLSEAQKGLNNWSKGNTNIRGRKWIHNNFDEKLIYPQELEKYIKLGYQRGRKIA